MAPWNPRCCQCGDLLVISDWCVDCKHKGCVACINYNGQPKKPRVVEVQELRPAPSPAKAAVALEVVTVEVEATAKTTGT